MAEVRVTLQGEGLPSAVGDDVEWDVHCDDLEYAEVVRVEVACECAEEGRVACDRRLPDGRLCDGWKDA